MTADFEEPAGLVREAGDSAWLLVFAGLEAGSGVPDAAINARAVAVAQRLQVSGLTGVRDVVPTFRSVAVHVDPLLVDPTAVAEALTRHADVSTEAAGGVVEVPVAYGGEAGPDLLDVAAFAGCTPHQVIDRHASRVYRGFMLGFLPGFAYMGTVDPRIAAPRRAAPRVRVPAGSVGIAGRQTGIYPCASPGGWQIVGRASLGLFNAAATPPARLAPGDVVRFVPVDPDLLGGNPAALPRLHSGGGVSGSGRPGRVVTVLRPGLLTTIQDAGRWGFQHVGVPVAGPMDRVAHRLSNALVGNAPDAAGLEATLVGPELRFEQQTWVALAGADLQASLDGAAVPAQQAVRCRPGSVLRFGGRRSGARAYVAFDGGIATPQVLGSRATHVRSGLGGMGGRALQAGDTIPLGPVSDRVPAPRRGRRSGPELCPPGGARLRLLPGPQAECLDGWTSDLVEGVRYTLSPQSDRMGYRLSSGAACPAAASGEMLSDAAFFGGLQVPPSGDPILLMADRQTTGGYPQLGVVIAADLPLAAQLLPGDWVEFQFCTRSEAIEALAEQEGAVLDLL